MTYDTIRKLKSQLAIFGVLILALMVAISGTALAVSTVLWDSQNQSGNLNAVHDETNSSGVSFTDSDGFAQLSEGDNYTSKIITLGESPGMMSVTYDAPSDNGGTITLYDSSDTEIASSGELTDIGMDTVYFETDATDVYFEVTFPDDSDGTAETFTVENVTFETGSGALNVDPVDVNGDSLSPDSIDYTLTDDSGTVVEEGTAAPTNSPPYFVGGGIEAGDYTLDLSVSGYQDVSKNVSVSSDGSLNTVTATFEEPATGTLSIDTVTDQDSNTIDTVEYDVVDPNDGSIVVEGSETIPVSEEVETGTYDVTVTADGYDSVTKSVDITENATTSPSFSLTASTDPVTTGSAEITAQDIDGNAIEGATVELVDSSDTVVNTVDTGTDGVATFSDIETGDYTYNVSATDYQNVSGTSITISENSTVTDTTQLSSDAPSGGTSTDGFSIDPSLLIVGVILVVGLFLLSRQSV